MAKRGKRFTIHGAFKSKAAAKRKEKSVHGFIVDRRIRGKVRHVVLKPKGR